MSVVSLFHILGKEQHQNREGLMDSITVCHNVLNELQACFEETGDVDQRPTESMFMFLLSAYSRLNRPQARASATSVDDLIALMTKNGCSLTNKISTAGE